MSNSAYMYPLDPTGLAISNKIVAENHTVQPPNNISDSSFVIPRATPFFGESLIVRTGPTETSQRLEEGIDYLLTHNFVTVSSQYGKQIYGSITLINRAFSNDIFLTYQTLGGDFTSDNHSIIEERTRQLYNILTVTWEQVSGNYPQLPPYSHDMNSGDLVGFGEVTDAVNRLAASIRQSGSGDGTTSGTGGDSAALLAHMQANNAHTKAQVGLGLVDNFKTANEADVVNLSSRAFLTPAMGQYLLVNSDLGRSVAQLLLGMQGINTSINTINNKQVSTDDAINILTDTLNNLANGMDGIRGDLDDLIIDVNNVLDQYIGIPAKVSTLETTMIDNTNRIGALERSMTTSLSDIADLKTTITTLSTNVTALMNMNNIPANIYLAGDVTKKPLIKVPVGKVVILNMVGAINNTSTIKRGYLYSLTSSTGVINSPESINNLTPLVTVKSMVANPNQVTLDDSTVVDGYLFTAGGVDFVSGITVVNKTVVEGRTPNATTVQPGDIIAKLPDIQVNNVPYPISYDVAYNAATPKGVPGTGACQVVISNTGTFDLTFVLAGELSLVTVSDNTLPNKNPINVVY